VGQVEGAQAEEALLRRLVQPPPGVELRTREPHNRRRIASKCASKFARENQREGVRALLLRCRVPEVLEWVRRDP
jgi:hypothetical protein